MIQGAFGIAFDFGERAILDVHESAAAAVAAPANALQYLGARFRFGRHRYDHDPSPTAMDSQPRSLSD
ncbi:hypothetical protein D3C83_309620 [compost metagenome]